MKRYRIEKKGGSAEIWQRNQDERYTQNAKKRGEKGNKWIEETDVLFSFFFSYLVLFDRHKNNEVFSSFSSSMEFQPFLLHFHMAIYHLSSILLFRKFEEEKKKTI